MKIEVEGQADIRLAVGGVGDKTKVITLTAGITRVRLTNLEPLGGQSIMYSGISGTNKPAYPGDWHRIDPGQSLFVDCSGGTTNEKVYLRKALFYRSVGRSQLVGDINDVKATAEIEEISWA